MNEKTARTFLLVVAAICITGAVPMLFEGAWYVALPAAFVGALLLVFCFVIGGSNTNSKNNKRKNNDFRLINDVTCIKSCQKRQNGTWFEYIYTIDAAPFGWNRCVQSIQYLAENDIQNIYEICASNVGQGENIVQQFCDAGFDLTNVEILNNEHNSLSIAGNSEILELPVKVVFFSQINCVYILTTVNNDDLASRYLETIVRQNIGTLDQMRHGRPKNSIVI